MAKLTTSGSYNDKVITRIRMLDYFERLTFTLELDCGGEEIGVSVELTPVECSKLVALLNKVARKEVKEETVIDKDVE